VGDIACPESLHVYFLGYEPDLRGLREGMEMAAQRFELKAHGSSRED
jgi:hypothetical protein